MFNKSKCSNQFAKSITKILQTCNCYRLGKFRWNTWAWCQIFFVKWMHFICCDIVRCGCIRLLQMKVKQNQYQNTKPIVAKIWRRKNQRLEQKTLNKIHKKELNYLKLFVHVLLMAKGLLISKRVISIQLSRNNALQGAISNALIHLTIFNKKWMSSNNRKLKQLMQTEGKPTITFTPHSFWHCYGLKFSSHILLTPKLLQSLKLQCPA